MLKTNLYVDKNEAIGYIYPYLFLNILSLQFKF